LKSIVKEFLEIKVIGSKLEKRPHDAAEIQLFAVVSKRRIAYILKQTLRILAGDALLLRC